jgi:hypothetical protein
MSRYLSAKISYFSNKTNTFHFDDRLEKKDRIIRKTVSAGKFSLVLDDKLLIHYCPFQKKAGRYF